MKCLVCLETASESIEIFGEIGEELGIAKILEKHFWFTPVKDDGIATVVCQTCWSRVNEFHAFYVQVEQAHLLLSNESSTNVEEPEVKVFPEPETVILLPEPNVEMKLPPEDCYETLLIPLDIEKTKEEDLFEDVTEVLPKAPVRRSKRSCAKQQQTLKVAKSKTSKTLRGKRPKKQAAVIKKEPQNEDEAKGLDESASDARRKTKASQKIDQMISDYMKLFCPVCHQEKAKFCALKRHMEQDHNKRSGYAVCCNKKFRQRCQLADHVRHHLDPSYFKCKECQREFADGQCLRNHMLALHQPDEMKVFPCPDCPKRFAKAFLLRYHRLTWHAEKNHICHICNKGCASQPLLKSHIKVFHGDYGIVCELCAKVLKGRAAYERHKLDHAGLPAPKVQCTTCGAWLAHSRSLKRHIKLQHSETCQDVKCPVCDKVCLNQWALDVHHRNMHTAERVHACTLCDKRFKKAFTLKEHMATHTGETLYTCSFCPQTFKSKANMYAHRKKKHPVEYEKDLQKRIEARFSVPSRSTE